MAEVAINNQYKIEIERALELKQAYNSGKRNQWHYAPDISIYYPNYDNFIGAVDYESTDATLTLLEDKKFFVIENLKKLIEIPNSFFFLIITIPDYKIWNFERGSLEVAHIPLIKNGIQNLSKKINSNICYFMIINKTKLELYKFSSGNEIHVKI